MKSSIFILSLLVSSVGFARVNPSSEVVEQTKEVYKTISQELGQIGDTSSRDKVIGTNDLLIQRVTTLMAYKRSDTTQVDVVVPDGVFLMLAPKKEVFHRTEADNQFDETTKDSFKHHLFDNDNHGSAFLYNDYIVTNYHMCRGLNTLVRDHYNKIYAVKVLKWNERQDLCILQAPKEVKDQRNFALAKSNFDEMEEEKRTLKLQIEIEKIKHNFLFTNEDKEKIIELKKEIKDPKQPRSYGKVFSMWGEFKVTNITPDNMADKWKKTNGLQATASKCLPGISGGVVTSPQGILGYAWGATANDDRSPASVKDSNVCYFINISQIKELISDYEKEVKK
jgi:hypothetical protein